MWHAVCGVVSVAYHLSKNVNEVGSCCHHDDKLLGVFLCSSGQCSTMFNMWDGLFQCSTWHHSLQSMYWTAVTTMILFMHGPRGTGFRSAHIPTHLPPIPPPHLSQSVSDKWFNSHMKANSRCSFEIVSSFTVQQHKTFTQTNNAKNE